MARLNAKWNNFSERGQTWDHFWQDAATASSGTAYTLSLSDTVTLSDALAKAYGLSKSDGVTLSDVIVKGFGKSASDSITLSESVVKAFGLSKSDSIALSEILTKGIGMSISDSMTLSELMTSTGGSGGGSQPAPIISVTLQPDEDMKRREVRAFIQSGIETLTETAQFNSGKIAEFNSQPDKGYPFCWLDSLKVKSELTTTYLPVDDWDISILIVKQDSLGSAPEEYEEIIDHCDELAQQLIYQINNQVSGYKLVTIKGISRDPFIKKLADCTTGVNLSFTLTAPDLTNNC
jgi:hypothetical protein